MYANFLSDLGATLPITIVGVVGIAIVLYDSFRNDAPELPWIAAAGTAVAIIVTFVQFGETTSAFGGHLLSGGFAAYMNVVILFGTLGSLLLSSPYLTRIGHNYGEVHALILFATVGMMVMASSGSLVTMFVGLETMTICFYILTGLVRRDPRATEAALKFFLLGAFSSAFFLYGVAMLYGASGTLMLSEMGAALTGVSGAEALFLWVGIGLLMVGFFFKVSAVPFHMWTPDVYQGAPSTITGFISTTAKVSAFAALVLALSLILDAPELVARWGPMMAVIAAITMIVGNIIALAQTNVKRLLAYSWIAHSGYVMAGLASGTASGMSATLYYLLAYTIMNLGAFGVIAAVEWDGKQGAVQTIDSLAGVGYRKPILGVSMAVFMFGLMGFPPLAGFIGKYLVFAAAVEGGLTWLAVIGVITSVISAYYYLRVMVAFWMRDPETAPEEAQRYDYGTSPVTRIVIGTCAVALLWFGIFNGGVIELATSFFSDGATLLVNW